MTFNNNKNNLSSWNTNDIQDESINNNLLKKRKITKNTKNSKRDENLSRNSIINSRDKDDVNSSNITTKNSKMEELEKNNSSQTFKDYNNVIDEDNYQLYKTIYMTQDSILLNSKKIDIENNNSMANSVENHSNIYSKNGSQKNQTSVDSNLFDDNKENNASNMNILYLDHEKDDHLYSQMILDTSFNPFYTETKSNDGFVDKSLELNFNYEDIQYDTFILSKIDPFKEKKKESDLDKININNNFILHSNNENINENKLEDNQKQINSKNVKNKKYQEKIKKDNKNLNEEKIKEDTKNLNEEKIKEDTKNLNEENLNEKHTSNNKRLNNSTNHKSQENINSEVDESSKKTKKNKNKKSKKTKKVKKVSIEEPKKKVLLKDKFINLIKKFSSNPKNISDNDINEIGKKN